MPRIARGYEWAHMTNAFRRTVERRNKSIWRPLSPTEKSAKRTPFRLIALGDEMLTAYVAKKLTFARVGPIWLDHSPAGALADATALYSGDGARDESLSGPCGDLADPLCGRTAQGCGGERCHQ